MTLSKLSRLVMSYTIMAAMDLGQQEVIPLVVGARYGFEGLLAGRVPDLDLYVVVVDL